MADPTYAGKALELAHGDSFRLLQLEPAATLEEPIKIRLINSRVTAAPSYEALSYTWGDLSAVASVEVMDKGPGEVTEMYITANCFAALKRLRKRDTPRILWVGAVCINQSLIPERNHQLGLMTRIYKSASRVVVYLGEEQDNSDQVIAYFREIDSPSDYGAGEATPPDKGTLRAFFARPWFHRVWVLQEIAFAKKAVFVCGSQELEWEALRSFDSSNNSASWRRRITLPFSIRHAISRSNGRSAHGYGALEDHYQWGLHGILDKSRSCRATDPRDKVYAVLSLVETENQTAGTDDDPSHEHQTITPDYSLSTAEVFTRVAGIILPNIGLQQLVDLHVPNPPTPNLPSWAPDWTATSPYSWGANNLNRDYLYAGTDKTHHMGGVAQRRLGFFESGFDLSDSTTYSLNTCTKSLHIRGAVYISRVSSALGPVCSVANNYLPLEEWEALTLPEHHVPEPKAPEGESTVDWWNGPKSLSPFYRCLAADGVVYPDTIRNAVEKIFEYNEKKVEHLLPVGKRDERFAVDMAHEFVADRSGGAKERPPLGTQMLRELFQYESPSLKRQSEVVLAVCDGKRMGRTEDGKIGMLPPNTQEGDEVWVVRELRMAMVFRRVGDDQDGDGRKVMSFVGAAYVYGVMAGEVWDRKEVVEDIVIR